MGLPSWPVLLSAASISGLAIGGLGLYIRKQVDNYVNQSNFFRRAIALTMEQPAVKQLVGEDIKIGRSTFNDNFGKVGETQLQIKIPIEGKEDKAYLMAYARKRDRNDKFRLFKLEAQFSKIKDKKLIILDRTNEGQDSDEEWEEEQSRLDVERAEAIKLKLSKERTEKKKQRNQTMTAEERERYYLEKMKEMEPKK